MKLTPRIILGIAATALIIASIALAIVFTKKDQSYILLTSKENRFDLNFRVQKKDQENFQKILSSLEIPQDVQNGVNFQLDSTSSARLNFLAPIKASLNLKDKSVNLSGETSIPMFLYQSSINQVRLPKSTNLAIFAPSLENFVKARLNLPQNISSWLDKNFSQANGSYLAVYGPNPDYSLLIKKDQISFDDLRNLKDSNGDAIYKEESSGDIKLHFLQTPSTNFQDQQTLTFFQLGTYQVMSSSPAAAKSLIDAQKSQDYYKFPQESNQKAALLAEFSNSNENTISDQAESFLLQSWERSISSKTKLASSIKRIKFASFALKEQSFSGLINLK